MQTDETLDQQQNKIPILACWILFISIPPAKECELMKRVAIFSFVPPKTPLLLFTITTIQHSTKEFLLF